MFCSQYARDLSSAVERIYVNSCWNWKKTAQVSGLYAVTVQCIFSILKHVLSMFLILLYYYYGIVTRTVCSRTLKKIKLDCIAHLKPFLLTSIYISLLLFSFLGSGQLSCWREGKGRQGRNILKCSLSIKWHVMTYHKNVSNFAV